MATRGERLSEFVTDRAPPAELAVELLCEDHVGTYVVPFLCRFSDGAWRNGTTGDTIEADVLGWREPRALNGTVRSSARAHVPMPV